MTLVAQWPNLGFKWWDLGKGVLLSQVIVLVVFFMG